MSITLAKREEKRKTAQVVKGVTHYLAPYNLKVSWLIAVIVTP